MSERYEELDLRSQQRAWRNLANEGDREALSDEEARLADASWAATARVEQLPPVHDDWTTWLLMGGRGSGKTRAGAEWVSYMANHVGRIALVGETYGDVRSVMVEGDSGLLAVAPPDCRPVWHATRSRLEWPNGAVAQGFSSEDPEGLRGPQFGAAWCDEVAKWRHAEATWDMLQFALRLGDRPRQVATTTPRPTPLVRRLVADERTVVARMATKDNAANLSPAFLTHVVDRYRGTRLGRQELDGELIERPSGALWDAEALDAGRCGRAPQMVRVVVGVDPSVTSGAEADACGIVVMGRDAEGRGYVLADRTVEHASPAGWAAAVARTYEAYEADRIVVEVNQGGDLVETVLRGAGHALPIRKVRATRGKWLRAEPVAALYERGRIAHVGTHARLEDEMCAFEPQGGGRANGRSPDRLDALVWAATDLMIDERAEARLRFV